MKILDIFFYIPQKPTIERKICNIQEYMLGQNKNFCPGQFISVTKSGATLLTKHITRHTDTLSIVGIWKNQKSSSCYSDATTENLRLADDEREGRWRVPPLDNM